MDLGLSGKTAVVTGASRGIGRAIAEALAIEGVSVALVARSADELERVAAGLVTPGSVVAVDLREPDAPGHAVAAAVERFGRLDLLVNNAGATVRGDFLEQDDDAWTDGFALKFFAAVRGCRAAWPHLCAAGGAVVNVVGVGGRVGAAEFTVGGAVNAALLNLTKALADRGVRDGVRVSAVNPGTVLTGRLERRVAALAAERGLTPNEATAELAARAGVARFGRPEEVAAAVAFLLSPRAAYCQGTIVDVDGGSLRAL